LVKRLERIRGRYFRVDDGDTAPVAAERVKRLQRHGVVDAVKARLHDHEAGDAARGAEPRQRLDGRHAGEIGPLRHLRILLRGTNDVNVTVAAHQQPMKAFSDAIPGLFCARLKVPHQPEPPPPPPPPDEPPPDEPPPLSELLPPPLDPGGVAADDMVLDRPSPRRSAKD